MIDGKPTYQYSKLEAALSFTSSFRCAVDVGAHCGLWSMHLKKRFAMLHAFEPVAAHRECFMKNVGEFDGHIWSNALGAQRGMARMFTAPTSSGDSWVETEFKVGENQPGLVPIMTLDSFEFSDVDFLKIDCEGFELFVLQGAIQTLQRCKPCVIVEQKPGRAQKWGLGELEAVVFLQDLGAKLRKVMSGDYILSW